MHLYFLNSCHSKIGSSPLKLFFFFYFLFFGNCNYLLALYLGIFLLSCIHNDIGTFVSSQDLNFLATAMVGKLKKLN